MSCLGFGEPQAPGPGERALDRQIAAERLADPQHRCSPIAPQQTSKIPLKSSQPPPYCRSTMRAAAPRRPRQLQCFAPPRAAMVACQQFPFATHWRTGHFRNSGLNRFQGGKTASHIGISLLHSGEVLVMAGPGIRVSSRTVVKEASPSSCMRLFLR